MKVTVEIVEEPLERPVTVTVRIGDEPGGEEAAAAGPDGEEAAAGPDDMVAGGAAADLTQSGSRDPLRRADEESWEDYPNGPTAASTSTVLGRGGRQSPRRPRTGFTG